MNSNRTKYASAPTYGMQKRNFAKKQAAAQAVPTPDFTQQPGMDMNAPLSPFPAQNLYTLPQNAFPASQQAGAPFFGVPQQAATAISQAIGAPPYGMQQQPYVMNQAPVNAANYGMPQQALGSAPYAQPGYAQAAGMPFTGGTPGYAPGAYQPNATGSPTVLRSEPVPDFTGNGSANFLGGMNGYPPAGGMMGTPGGAANAYGGFVGGAQAPAGYGFPGGAQAPSFSTGPYPPVMMNANGGGFGGPPYIGMNGGSPAMPTPRPPVDVEKWLKLFLYAILPMLFIPCVFENSPDFLRYLFIGGALIALSIVWYRQSFTQAVRVTVTVAYVVMCIVTIAMLVNGTRDTQQTGGLGAQNGAVASTEPSATPLSAPAAAQETPMPVEDVSESEAEQRLATFMDYWQVNRIEDMVNLVQPSWATVQDNAASALFTVISNRTPQEYTIEGISGVATDSSRTVTMSAYIDKNNGKDPVRYRFMILMVKESGQWYVDPNSLATNDVATETPSPAPGKETVVQSLAPRMTVTPIPDPSTKLYYNANGGKYYHLDPNCSAVNPKFLPMASFLYSELDNAPFNSLQPCLKCGAPTQSLGSLAEATSTPTVAP